MAFSGSIHVDDAAPAGSSDSLNAATSPSSLVRTPAAEPSMTAPVSSTTSGDSVSDVLAPIGELTSEEARPHPAHGVMDLRGHRSAQEPSLAWIPADQRRHAFRAGAVRQSLSQGEFALSTQEESRLRCSRRRRPFCAGAFIGPEIDGIERVSAARQPDSQRIGDFESAML